MIIGLHMLCACVYDLTCTNCWAICKNFSTHHSIIDLSNIYTHANYADTTVLEITSYLQLRSQ